jgi:hypothetical protein
MTGKKWVGEDSYQLSMSSYQAAMSRIGEPEKPGH